MIKNIFVKLSNLNAQKWSLSDPSLQSQTLFRGVFFHRENSVASLLNTISSPYTIRAVVVPPLCLTNIVWFAHPWADQIFVRVLIDLLNDPWQLFLAILIFRLAIERFGGCIMYTSSWDHHVRMNFWHRVGKEDDSNLQPMMTKYIQNTSSS